MQCLTTEDDRARMARFLELIATTPADHFAAGSQAFIRTDEMGLGTMRQAERDFYWQQYGRLAREGAVKEAAKLAAKDASRYAGSPRKALQGWAEVAPAEASAWFKTNPEAVASDVLMYRPLVVGWAANDLKAATAFFVENVKPSTREFQDVLAGLRDFVAARGFAAALKDWFNSLPDQETEPSIKTLALPHVMISIEAAGFEETAKFLDSVNNRKIATDLVIQRFVTPWVAKGRGLEAMKWVLSRPKDDKGLRAGVPTVAQIWAAKDAKAFGAWMLENREHESIDQVLLGFVKFLSNRDIAEARKWIGEIKNPALKKEAEELL